MLLATLALSFCLQGPETSPPPTRQEPQPRPEAAPLPSSDIEVLDLGEGCKLQGRVIRATEQSILIDVGFDVLKVPLTVKWYIDRQRRAA